MTTQKEKAHSAHGSEVKSDKGRKAVDTDAILSVLDSDEEHLSLKVDDHKIELSNLKKVFWPEFQGRPAITKGSYIKYLVQVSSYLLPHLRDRLITLIRFPNGINHAKFYQKHWDDNLPKFVETVRVFTEHEDKDQDFLMCNNLPTLIWLGQIADLELHTSHTRTSPDPDGLSLPTKFTGSVQQVESSLLNYPDFMVFDLDPYLYSGKEEKGAEPELHREGFKRTCEVALWLKQLLDTLRIKAFVKTSGKTGLHIYVPIVREIDYDIVRELSESIGRSLLSAHNKEVTMEWAVAKRTGKVFFDHNMNARSKSLASIYSLRVSPEAMASTPLDWKELGKVYPTDFTIESLPERLEALGDLWSDILANKNDLHKILKSLPEDKGDSKKKSTGRTRKR